MQRALVTGGAGFIGSHLVRELTRSGTAVRVLDNVSSGDMANLEGLGRKIEFHEGDIRNAVACRNACREVDTVFHLAAAVSVPQSVRDPLLFDAVNSGGTLNLLLAARDSGVKRFVFSSSSAIYGETDTIPTHEGLLPSPLSPYGVQKLTGEHYCRNFTLLYGLETICLRYFNVYGPRQNPNSEYAAVIPKFIARMLAGEPLTVYGDGEQTRDFCYVGDVVAANLKAAETDRREAFGQAFNVAGGVRTTLNTLITKLGAVSGQECVPRYEPERPGDIRHSGADIGRARDVLGFEPRTPLRTGLRETLKFYKG